MPEIDVSIILPAFNEKENLLELIPEIRRVLFGVSYEIIVVDDASSDGTAPAIKLFNALNIFVIEQKVRRGFACSISDGLLRAQGECVIVMDADFNHNPADLKQLVELLKTYDCVSASRFINEAPLRLRFFISQLLGYLICFKTQMRITDPFFGFWGMRRGLFMQLPRDQIFFGFGDYAFRLFYFAKKANAIIFEFPSVHGQRRYGCGNQRLVWTFFRYVREILVFKG